MMTIVQLAIDHYDRYKLISRWQSSIVGSNFTTSVKSDMPSVGGLSMIDRNKNQIAIANEGTVRL